MAEIVYLEARGTADALFHAVGVPPHGKPRITRCGIWVTPAMPEAHRDLGERRARPCARCYHEVAPAEPDPSAPMQRS